MVTIKGFNEPDSCEECDMAVHTALNGTECIFQKGQEVKSGKREDCPVVRYPEWEDIHEK